MPQITLAFRTPVNGLLKMVGRFRRSEFGGAAIELAVVSPLLLLLLIGVVDYGRAFYTSITVSNAARAGAEYGAQGPIQSGDIAGMKAFAQGDGQEAGTLTVNARRYCECGGAAAPCSTVCTGGAAPDVFIEVTATKSLSMLLPYPGLPSTLAIARTATFRSQ
jgi:Flp pilus assembly protein TadG